MRGVRLRASTGSGHLDDHFGVEINDSSGHFGPGDGLIKLGVEKVDVAGIDVFSRPWRDGGRLRQFAPGR